MRHALTAFLTALGLDREALDDVQTAVGEALANAVEHAYDGSELGAIELAAQLSDNRESLSVDVFDRGTFIEREARPGRGFGLRIVSAIVRDFRIATDNGTHVSMVFGIANPGLRQCTL